MSSAAGALPKARRLAGRPVSTSRRILLERAFVIFCVLSATASVAILALLLGSIVFQTQGYLDASFLKKVPSRFPHKAGMWPAIVGSVAVCVSCAMFALPIGIGTAVFLEEYRPTKSRWMKRLHSFVQLNISNLAGVPSIVYGIIGLTAFVEGFGIVGSAQDPLLTIGSESSWYFFRLPFGRGVLAGGLTLMLVILPIVIISAQEALRAVPDSLRHAALGLGATRWQMVSQVSLPSAIPGIMTGSILAMSRAIGEAAPMLVISGAVYITFLPRNVMESFTVMPLQIYEWAKLPQKEFHHVAAAGIVVLLVVLLAFNAFAVFIRQKFHKPLS
ncbi:MAG: PstA family ABC transporter permease [Planctomycetota bacterium]